MMAVRSFSGAAGLPLPDPPLRVACGHAPRLSTSQILAGAPRILSARAAFCAGQLPRAFPRLVGGHPSYALVTVLLVSEGGRPEPIEADPSAPLSASLHDYLETNNQPNARLQFYFSRGPLLGEAVELTRTPRELGIEDGDMLRVREDMGAGTEVPPSWQGRPIAPGSKYARTLTYWMETLGLRGGCPQRQMPPVQSRSDPFAESSDAMDDGAEPPPFAPLEVRLFSPLTPTSFVRLTNPGCASDACCKSPPFCYKSVRPKQSNSLTWKG